MIILSDAFDPPPGEYLREPLDADDALPAETSAS